MCPIFQIMEEESGASRNRGDIFKKYVQYFSLHFLLRPSRILNIFSLYNSIIVNVGYEPIAKQLNNHLLFHTSSYNFSNS